MLARLFVLVGGLIVLALSVALVGPYFVDWTPYRGDFEREASRILGRDVTVAGDATARILPFPSVTFADVRVAGGADGQPAMTVETFSMDAELAPFMSGEILIFDMRLVKPRATVSVAEDGRIDWAIRPTAPVSGGSITLERLTVTDGAIDIVHGPSGRTHRISDIDSTVSARSLAGPWRFEGTLGLDGVRTKLLLSTGTLSEDGSMRLRIVADPEDYPLAFELDGDATLAGGLAAYKGAFRIHAPDEGEGEQAKPGSRVAGLFEIGHDRIAAPEYRFEAGPVEDPYVAEGQASLEFGSSPRFSIVADGAQVRLDPAADGETTSSGATLSDRIAALKALLTSIPKPGIDGTVEVNLPAVVAGDTTIRDVKLSAVPAEDGWTVKSLGAQLPGRTTLEASGKLRTGADFGFSGSMLLAVAQPSGFAAWISRDVDEAIRRLPAAGFLSTVDLSEQKQTFRDLELILGASRFRGRIDSATPPDARPVMQADLAGGELDLDGIAAFASLFVDDAGASRFSAHQIDLALKAGPVRAGGVEAATLDTALRMRDGAIEIDRLLIGDLAGASISATGRVADLSDALSGKLDASLVAADLAPLVALVSARFPDNALLRALNGRAEANPGLYADAVIDIVAATSEKDAALATLTLSGKAGGSDFSLQASGARSLAAFDATPLSIALTAKNPDAAAIFALYGVPTIPLGLGGAADTVVTARGKLADGLRTRVILTGETADLSFEGTVRRVDGETSLSGAASVEATDIEPWFAMTGTSLPGMGMGLPVTLAAKADVAGAMLILSGLAGEIAGTRVEGDLNAELRNGLPHLSGALQLGAFDLALPATSVLGDGVLGEAAMATDSDAAFATDAKALLTAELDIAASELMIGSSVRIVDARFNGRLDREGLRVSNVTGAYLGGTLAGLAELRNTDGTGLLSLQMSLSGADLAAVLPQAGLAGVADLGANLTASGKSLGGLAAALSGSGTAAVRDLAIDGLDPKAFAPILARADQIGREVNAETVAGFAPALARGGQFRAGNVELAFTVANGVVRAPPVRLAGEGATVTAETRANLAEGTVGVTGEIAYDPGDASVTGSSPVIDFVADGKPGEVTANFDTGRLTQFLTQRALEIEQARVEALQAGLLEKQRLRREVAYFSDRAETRRRVAQEKARQELEARRRAQEQARLDAEARAAESLAREEELRRRPPEPAPAPEVPQPPVPSDPPPDDAIERRPLPAPRAGDEASAAPPADASTIFRVFGEDGRSIDSILNDLAPVR